ncbi:MAG TPA: response regulator [Gemmatimonadaceae bacterium]|nr:response regulator [Gemmatimonadaceae bacterium]
MSAGRPSYADTPDAPEKRQSQRRAVILVVDRDPNIRELESYFLNEAGYQVEFAEDGMAALDLARRLRPDIVVCEVLVPKLDGLALSRALKSDPATGHIAVLVFSILAASVRAREAGADAFLMKPLAERRLVQTVRALLAARAAARTEAAASAASSSDASPSTPSQP